MQQVREQTLSLHVLRSTPAVYILVIIEIFKMSTTHEVTPLRNLPVLRMEDKVTIGTVFSENAAS